MEKANDSFFFDVFCRLKEKTERFLDFEISVIYDFEFRGYFLSFWYGTVGKKCSFAFLFK